MDPLDAEFIAERIDQESGIVRAVVVVELGDHGRAI